MKNIYSSSLRRLALPGVMVALALSFAGVARGDIMYTFSSNEIGPGVSQFTEASVLTAATTVNIFATDSLGLTSLSIAPQPGGSCFPASPAVAPGPCIGAFMGGHGFFFFYATNLTSPGTHASSSFGGILQISQTTAPEPGAGTLVLLGTLMVAGLWVGKRCNLTRRVQPGRADFRV